MTVMHTLYRWLLHLYPATYRREYAEEMAAVFRQARRDVSSQPVFARLIFCAREIGGILSGTLGEHFRAFFGGWIPIRRFDMRPEFRFPRSTVLLMTLLLVGVVLTIKKAVAVQLSYGGSLDLMWPALGWFVAFMLGTMSALAALVWTILFALRRTGMHRLANVQPWPDQR